MNKSLYILIALIIGASSVFAQSGFGKKLELNTDETGKAAGVSMAYSYDYAWGWLLNLRTTLKNEDIAALPDKLTVQLIDASSKKTYHTWTDVSKFNLVYAQMGIRDEATLREILPIQKQLSVAFLNTQDNSYVYNFPLSEICGQYSETVRDLTKPERTGCYVDSDDFYKKDDCSAQRLRLLESIRQGFITCAAAKEFYKKMGCGVLDCN